MFPMIVTKSYINLVIDGKSKTVDVSNKYFSTIVESIKSKDWDKVRDLVDIATMIEKETDGKITVQNGEIFYKGQPVHNMVATQILTMIDEGFDVIPMMLFLENLMKNPWPTAIDELYNFLEQNILPITDDGCFLAYKCVTSDFKDKHTQTEDNSVGSHVEMDRDRCEPDRHSTCSSSGYHFCSLGYLAGFGRTGDKIIIIKINPADVTSFPYTTEPTKGRCFRYDVVSLYGNYEDVATTEKWTKSVETGYLPDSVASNETMELPYDNPIRAARMDAGVSQRELAEHAGYNKSTLWNAEQPDNKPKLETVERWIAALNGLLSDKGTDLVYTFTDGKLTRESTLDESEDHDHDDTDYDDVDSGWED